MEAHRFGPMSDALELVESRRALAEGSPDTARDALAPPPTVRQGEEDLEPDHRSCVYFLWYGHRRIKTNQELRIGWRAVRAIASGDGVLTEAERLILVGRMCATGVPEAIVQEVMAGGWRDDHPADLLASIVFTSDAGSEMGAWVLYEGLSVALADGAVEARELERVRGVAATLGVPRQTLEAIVALCLDEAILRERRIATLRDDVASAVHAVVEHAPSTTNPARPLVPGEMRLTLPFRREPP